MAFDASPFSVTSKKMRNKKAQPIKTRSGYMKYFARRPCETVLKMAIPNKLKGNNMLARVPLTKKAQVTMSASKTLPHRLPIPCNVR